MAIDWDADVLAPAMAVFGEDAPCRYMPARGAPFDLDDAVFDEQSGELEFDSEMTGATVRRPVLGVRTALFQTPPRQNDRVRIAASGKVYRVSDVRPDGHGHARLILMDDADQRVS